MYLSGHAQLTYDDKVIILGGRGGSYSNDRDKNYDIYE